MHAHVTFISLCIIHLLAVLSPGPDVLVMLRSSLAGGVSRGLFTMMGIVSSNAVHLVTAVLGAAYLAEHHPWMMTGIKIAGAMYLTYIGVKCLGSKPVAISSEEATSVLGNGLSRMEAFQDGVFTALPNGKAIVYFISIATQFNMEPTNLAQNLVGMGILLSITASCFTVLANVAGHQMVRSRLRSQQQNLDRAMGTVLIAYSGVIIAGVL